MLRIALTALTPLTLLGLCACSEEGPQRPPIGSGDPGAGDSQQVTPPEGGTAQAWFSEVTAAWGLEFVHHAGRTPEKHLPETMGGGAALLDAEGDGDLDLYLVQGGPLPGSPTPGAAPSNQLFENDGTGRLVDATGGIGAGAHRGYGMGVGVGDLDGDGLPDLYLANLGPDALLHNEGGGLWSDATRRAGIHDPRWTASALPFDPDGDGDLDIYVTAYLAVDLEKPAFCGRHEAGWRSYCHPDHYEGLPDRLWRNLGDGRFVDATADSGLADSSGKGLGALAADLDEDGDLDLYVANDSVENRHWENTGDGRFVDATALAGTGVNGRGATEAGMGLAVGDVDGDGRPDLLVSNFDHESNTLYRNIGDGLFEDATLDAGLEAPSHIPVGFGVVLEDLDGDGDLDLAVANGHIIDNIQLYDDGQRWRQHPQLFVNEGAGRLREATVEGGDLVTTPLIGRGLHAGDLDGDGDLDLLLTQCGAGARLYRNDHRGGSHIQLKELPPGTRVMAVTASGRRLWRQAGGAPSYLGRGAPGIHLGLPAGDRLVRLSARAPGAGEVELPLPGARH